MKKVNMFTSSKSFTANVAEYTLKALWRYEYKLRLQAQIEKDEKSILGLSNCKGSAIMTDEQVDAAIDEKLNHIELLKTAYGEVSNHWTRVKPHEAVKEAYKAYTKGNAAEGFVTMLTNWAGLKDVTEDSDLVQELCKAVAGDSAGSNTTQLVNTGIASVSVRSKTEFTKVVYRRLFDYCVTAGTIRFVGNVVRGGGEDVAELLVETPSFTAAKCLKKMKKKSTK